jgi:hypothetical protein
MAPTAEPPKLIRATSVVPPPVDSVVDRLRAARAQRAALDVEISDLVAEGRQQGLTWPVLAAPLEVTPQAVQKRYGGRSS